MSSRARAARCLATVAGTVFAVTVVMEASRGTLTFTRAVLAALYFAAIALALYPLGERLARNRLAKTSKAEAPEERTLSR